MRISALLSFPVLRRSACLLPVAALGIVGGCSSDGSPATTLPLPTGHYEGPVSYQGSELRVALDLRETAAGQLEADVHFPELAGQSFAAANVRYKEPQLIFERPGPAGKATVTAIREGDFLRGVLTLDSIKADFVWARRGQAAPRAYQEKAFSFPAHGRTQRLTLLVPTDTVARHPAVALLADAASAATAAARADLLARQGFVAVVVPITAPASDTDSTTLHGIVAAFQALRRQPCVDSLRVGFWLRGQSTGMLIPAAGLTRPATAFVVLENVPMASAADARPFQLASRQRLPVLALYAAADTSLNARESARRLRNALGGRQGSAVRTFPLADGEFIIPGRLSADGKWTWPQQAAGFAEGLVEWLRQRKAR